MSWARVYRVALRLLPGELRLKHGHSMDALFEREVERARERGAMYATLVGAAGVADIVRRSAYERVRPARYVVGEYGESPAAPLLGTGHLLRRLAVSFTTAFVALTATLVALFAMKQAPDLGARGASTDSAAQLLLLAVPFTAAMTIPMAVFVAVLREFTRLGADGTLAAARRARKGMRRLITPVLTAATMIAALALVEITTILPPANTQLASMLLGNGAPPNSRTMTLGELRDAERTVRAGTERINVEQAALYEVEIQKKFALPAACLVMALAGVAFGLCVPRGGVDIVLAASIVVLGAYYLVIITGENLALRLVVSPAIGMWGANAILFAVALLAVWWRGTPRLPNAGEPVVARG